MQSKYSFSCGDAALTVNVYGIPRVAVQLAACKKPTLKQVYSVGFSATPGIPQTLTELYLDCTRCPSAQ